MLQVPGKRVLSVLVALIALGLSTGAWAERVDWSEYMEAPGAPPPSTGAGKSAASAPKPAKVAKGKKAKKGKKGKKGKRAARKGKGRR